MERDEALIQAIGKARTHHSVYCVYRLEHTNDWAICLYPILRANGVPAPLSVAYVLPNGEVTKLS